MNKIIELNETLINNAKQELKAIPFSKTTIKLKTIAALNNNSITKVAEVFGIRRNTIKSWIRRFSISGVEGLENKPRAAKKSKLNEQRTKELIRLITVSDGQNWTLLKLQKLIQKKYGIEISKAGIWKILKKLGFSHITARPVHHKQDKEKLEEFKKNSNEPVANLISQKIQHQKIWFGSFRNFLFNFFAVFADFSRDLIRSFVGFWCFLVV
jgi:transposase